jgi:hypothetical protein
MDNKLIIFLTAFLSSLIFGQVGVNNNTPDSSSILDITANPITNNKGVLLPKVHLTSITDNTTILSPAKGLIIFNTNGLIGEGIYVNEGTSSSPLWQGMKTMQSEVLSRFISTMIYTGATTNPVKILNSDTFQWRLISNGAFYELQARLKAIPGQNVVTTSTYLLGWNDTATAVVLLPSFVWTPANWNIWQNMYSYASGEQGLFYFGIQNTDKLFRVNVFTVTDSYNSLLIEQF